MLEEKNILAIDDLCEFLSQIWQRGLAIVNMNTMEVLYVSEQFTRETTIRNRDIQIYGIDAYKKYLHPKDYTISMRIHEAFIHAISKSESMKSLPPMVVYNVKLKTLKGDYKNFSMVLKIVNTMKMEGGNYLNIGLVVCVPETLFGFERFFIQHSDQKKRLYFSNSLGKFVNREHLEFRNIEKEILQMIAEGCNESRIAKQLRVKIDLVRYYKKCIYQKLYVSNMSEAIYIATNQKLI